MNRQIGVDFGTTTSVLAYRDFDGQNEGAEKLVKFDGRDYVPTMVLLEGSIINKKGMEIRHEECFGWEAAMATSFHAFLKRDFKIGLISNNAAVRNEAKVLTEKFFRYMYKRYTASPITQKGIQFEQISTVVTYPGKFPEEAQQILKKAAEDAGFPNVTLVDESKAAMKFTLSYDTEDTKQFFQKRQGQKLKVMIIDMGAGTTDISVFEYDTADPSNFVHLCSWPEKGGNNFGGSEIDSILCDFYREKLGDSIVRILGTGNTELGEKLLRNKIKDFKEQSISDVLGRNDEVTDLPGDLATIKYSMPEEPDTDLDRAAFEELLKDYLPHFLNLVHGALNKGGLGSKDVDLVLLTGGHSQWYFVKEMLVKAGISGGSILSFPDPHLVAARGAAWYVEPEKKLVPRPELEAKQEILSNEWDVDAIEVPIVAQGIIDGFGCWTLIEDGLLTIDGKGDMPDWYPDWGEPTTPWKDVIEKIKTISIFSRITSIGAGAFLHCTSLTNVAIPNNVIGIGEYAFGGCTNLKRVYISNTMKTMARNTFQNCPNLVDITVPQRFRLLVPTSRVISGGRVGIWGGWTLDEDNLLYIDFEGDMPHWEMPFMPSPWASMDWPSWMAHSERCKAVYLSERVTSIDNYAFFCFTEMTTIQIPDGVTDIGKCAFQGCKKLKEVSLPRSLVLIQSCTFQECKSLQKISIPDGVQRIGSYAFAECTELTEVVIPNSVTTIESTAFMGCKNLRKVIMPERFDRTFFKSYFDFPKSIVTFT